MYHPNEGYKMQNEESLGQIIRRLDVLILLQLENSSGGETATLAGKIRRLTELGLNAPEIASIIDKPLNYVTATISQQKKAARKRGKKK